MPASKIDVRERQKPIRQRYTENPASAPVVLRVESGSSDLTDPLHCAVVPAAAPGVRWHSGAHAAVGGAGDVPCSGDLLLGALAACQEVTIRMVAANMGIPLESLRVQVDGDWDPRGTLAMGDFPIGLTRIRSHTTVTIAGDLNRDRADRLLRSAEKYCVVLSTLRGGVPVESTFALATPAQADGHDASNVR
ncbi:MAG TPA: OsmC family protein [Candidatus Limnocylindrales bacterium]|nr:OsmC family protein [Candidatus Limnocylindrales bacterium]